MPVVFTAIGNATVYEDTGTGEWYVQITGAGSDTITAHQAGNAQYASAPDVAQTLTVAKANAVIVVTPYTGASTTYDGQSYTATGTATGVGGADLSVGLTLSSTTHTNAGTYSGDAWSFAGGTNYNDASGTIIDSIAKANATVTVSGYTGVYDGAYHGATGSEAGVNGENAGTLSLGATFEDVPGGMAYWVFTGNVNYNDQSGNVAIVITPAPPTVIDFRVLYGIGKSYDLTTSTRLDLPWMITGVEVVFDEAVFGTNSSLVRTNGALAIAGYSGNGTNTLIWTFQSALVTADVISQLVATGANGIHDATGNELDGDGNGGGGDAYSRTFEVLYGDFNDDGVVTLADAVLIRNAIGSSNIFADLNGDGQVDLSDVNIVRSRLGARLP